MKQALREVSTLNMSREDWLAIRRQSIGGSDAAAIIGMNSFSSPYKVWADKLGMLEDKEDNIAMWFGRTMEEPIAKKFAEITGKKVRRKNAVIYNPDYPFAHANVDFLIVGENAGLEIKTTSQLNTKSFRNGKYPDTYYVQCVHYMMVTGLERWYLAVLVGNKELKMFVIERDEDEIKALADAEAYFWRNVEAKTPPPVDGATATTESIEALYPASDDETEVDLFAYTKDLKRYIELTAEIKRLTEEKDYVSNIIKDVLRDASRGKNELFNVSWKTQTRSSFDSKAFKNAHPEIDLSPFYKTVTARPFKVSEVVS